MTAPTDREVVEYCREALPNLRREASEAMANVRACERDLAAALERLAAEEGS